MSGSTDKTLKVWDLESGDEVHTLTGHTKLIEIGVVAVTPDGRRAISGSADDTLKVWDLESGEAVISLTGHTRWGWVCSLAVTPDGRRSVSASYDETLKVWDLESGGLVATFTGEGAMYACASPPDGGCLGNGFTIVAGGTSGQVHILRLEGVT